MKTLSAYLANHSYSQEEFARRIGVTQATVCKWVNNHARPSLDLALRIEQITNGAVPVSSWARRENSKEDAA